MLTPQAYCHRFRATLDSRCDRRQPDLRFESCSYFNSLLSTVASRAPASATRSFATFRAVARYAAVSGQ
jgi:hypothetical protein